MHITIYFNDKPLFLTDTITDEIAPLHIMMMLFIWMSFPLPV